MSKIRDLDTSKFSTCYTNRLEGIPLKKITFSLKEKAHTHTHTHTHVSPPHQQATTMAAQGLAGTALFHYGSHVIEEATYLWTCVRPTKGTQRELLAIERPTRLYILQH